MGRCPRARQKQETLLCSWSAGEKDSCRFEVTKKLGSKRAMETHREPKVFFVEFENPCDTVNSGR